MTDHNDPIKASRAAVNDAVGHWFAVNTLAVTDQAGQRAAAADLYKTALDALIAVVQQQARAERDALAAALRMTGACGVGIRDCAEYTATGTHIPELAGILTDIAKQGGLIDTMAREALTRMGEVTT